MRRVSSFHGCEHAGRKLVAVKRPTGWPWQAQFGACFAKWMRTRVCSPGTLDRPNHKKTRTTCRLNFVGNLAQLCGIVARSFDFSLEIAFLHCRLASPFNCRSEEHTSELQSLMRISYAVCCLKKKKHITV